MTEGDRIGTKNEEWFFSPEDLRGFNKEEPSYFMPVGQTYVIVVEMNNPPRGGTSCTARARACLGGLGGC